MRRANAFQGLVAALALGGCAAPPASPEADLATQGDALSVCPGAATVKGVDTSQWQGPIDWSQVKASGQSFAIARVSDGIAYPDTQFATDWPAIAAAGLVRGAYQFFRPSVDPVAQAELLAQRLQQYGPLGPGDLPAIMDIETTDGVDDATLRANMATWLDRVQALTSKKPMIYTAAFMAGPIGTGFSSYPLWVANYEVTCPQLPAGWNAWVIWQSGDAGAVPGISGGVDVDVFDGTLADLQAFAAGSGSGGGGVSWSCSSSAYQGAQYWTCSGGNLYECQGGIPVEQHCALGCLSQPLGRNDLCISSAPSWPCSSSAYGGAQYWTCSGGSLYRCAGGAPESVTCPSGCVSMPLGTNDVCH
jgi:lysozyme